MGAGVLVLFLMTAGATIAGVWYLVEVRRVGRPAPSPAELLVVDRRGYAVDPMGRLWRDGE